MKQELDNDSIDALVKYRLERANETVLEAETLIRNGFYNAAVNRLYYACYYAVTALLVKKQDKSSNSFRRKTNVRPPFYCKREDCT